MDEKELKESMVSDEKTIMEKIRGVFDEHELKYSYDEDDPKHIGLGFSMENKPFRIHIILQNGKIIFRLSFPFRVQTNVYPLVCMFMAEFNENKAFSLLNLDSDDGELTMEYSYMMESSEQFNEMHFWVYMTSLIHPALEIYTKAAHLSMGMVSSKDRRLYRKLLEMALETVNGDFDDDNVSYGTESLRSDLVPDFLSLFGKDDGESGKEEPDSEDEDITTDLVQSLRGSRIPSFEEFKRMKEQSEESSKEEKANNQTKTTGMLSLFAKRDEDKDRKVVGDNEDE